MAFCTTALLGLALQAQPITLSYFQQHFIVRDGVYNESAPLTLAPEPAKLSTVFRRNKAFAVWDDRGLTIRVGSKAKSTKLPDISTSPKAFTKDEIRRTLAEIKARRRTREASGLSGAVRVGSNVYFLARWSDSDGKTWAEALVDVDLGADFPEPKFVARIKALSMATQPIDDQMFILEGKPTFVARTTSRWGIAQIDLKTKRVSLDELGDRLESYLPQVSPEAREHPNGPKLGLFVERTAYGTTIAGRVDLFSRYRKTLAEAKATMRFLDAAEPACIVVSFGNSAVLHNAATGSEMDLPVPSSSRRLSRGIVVWTPVSEPKRAWLLDPARWQVKAFWPPATSVERP